MARVTSQHPPDQDQSGNIEALNSWSELVGPAIDVLRRLSGNTEDEFLQIGSRLQSFYQRSQDISGLAGQLVETVAGERLQLLIERLRQMMADMEMYLAGTRSSSSSGCATLVQVQTHLDDLSRPLEGFQKMNKTLRMLSISTKIESSRLGELGSGFSNLAMDVEKLSHQVNEKSADILAHRQLMLALITTNLEKVHANEKMQDAEINDTLARTSANLKELVSANERFSSFGEMISSVSYEVGANIGEVVSSQQFHDITRQQIEHVYESLELLLNSLKSVQPGDTATLQRLIIEAGDVCELQEAQLRFAVSELYSAVASIADNLREIARKQVVMSQETMSITGVASSGGNTFVDNMQRDMASVTAVLTDCASTDHELAVTMQNVAATIEQITSFVGDIENIGSEIDLIALNSQVKAAHTGQEGAALGVLAEAIKRLSDEAVRQTDDVSATLTNIQTATRHISNDSGSEESAAGTRVAEMECELTEIIGTLNIMNRDMYSLLGKLRQNVNSLTEDVEQAAAGIDVHEKSQQLANEVLASLDLIVQQSRRIAPASSEFKQNMKHMEERYTMESERKIHNAISIKRGFAVAATPGKAKKVEVVSESEFGDNVDLF